jgi:hypothetical protein
METHMFLKTSFKSSYFVPAVLFAFLIPLGSCELGLAQIQTKDKQTSAADRIAKAASKINKGQRYLLQYKLKKGEELKMVVEQVVSTKFQMAGELEESSSRSASAKTWRVANVDSLGQITFALVLDSIDMWQKVGDGEPVAYNSRKDKEIPDEYKVSANFVGKTLAVFSIKPNGTVLDRKSSLREDNFGVGKVTTPLPEMAVPVGYKWSKPTVLEATDEDGINRKLKARILYSLDKVKSGKAYIKFRTEVLTPVTSEKIKSTIMQKLTNGYVVFDIEKGRPVLKQIEWDEKAQGFEGPDSFLQYVGRMSERVVDSKSKSVGLSPIKTDVATKPAVIKTKADPPIIRK